MNFIDMILQKQRSYKSMNFQYIMDILMQTVPEHQKILKQVQARVQDRQVRKNENK